MPMCFFLDGVLTTRGLLVASQAQRKTCAQCLSLPYIAEDRPGLQQPHPRIELSLRSGRQRRINSRKIPGTPAGCRWESGGTQRGLPAGVPGISCSSHRKAPNVGAGASGIWEHREETQRSLHETMRLAEAWLMRRAPGGSMPSQTLKNCKIQSRKDAPKMAILEASCAQNAPGRSTMRLPEALLPRNPTWESSHFQGLTKSASSKPQAREGNLNPNFWVRISSGGVEVFHVKGRGTNSSVCPSKLGENKLFWWDIPGFCRDILEVPGKLEEK